MVSPILSIQKVSKKFGAVIASEDVSIDLYQGEIHGLIGPNGAGKSTLIKQISGELKQDSGKIVLGEVEISNHPVFARAKMGLARSFQVSSIIPNFTVLENVIILKLQFVLCSQKSLQDYRCMLQIRLVFLTILF